MYPRWLRLVQHGVDTTHYTVLHHPHLYPVKKSYKEINDENNTRLDAALIAFVVLVSFPIKNFYLLCLWSIQKWLAATALFEPRQIFSDNDTPFFADDTPLFLIRDSLPACNFSSQFAKLRWLANHNIIRPLYIFYQLEKKKNLSKGSKRPDGCKNFYNIVIGPPNRKTFYAKHWRNKSRAGSRNGREYGNVHLLTFQYMLHLETVL